MTVTDVDTIQPADQTGRGRVPRSLLFLIAALVVVAGAWAARWLTASPQIDGNLSSGDGRVAPAFIVPAEVDRLIAAYERRIEEGTDALDHRTLGHLYLEKGRLTGDMSRYSAALAAFEKAVELFPSDPGSRVGMSSAHYSLHDFVAARDEANLVYDATQRVDSLAVLADANLALGNYEVGVSQLDSLVAAAGDQPGVLVRRAEHARIEGEAEAAMQHARAASQAVADSHNPRRRSWYQAFAAQMALLLGHPEEGLVSARAAMETDPTSDTATIATARLLAASGDYDEAIALYEPIVASRPDPTFVAELGDLYTLTGRDGLAQDQYATVGVTAELAEAQGVFDRAMILYLADHGLDPAQAVATAEAELERRTDVGAWDAYAWALHSAGRYDDARQASDRALALGTVDGRFLYHAGMISAALGQEERARAELSDALALGFGPLPEQRATETLEALG